MYIPEEQQRQIGHFFLSLGFFSIKKIIGKIYQPQSNILSPRVIQMQKNIGLLNSKITCQIKINECIEQLIACYNLQLVSERTDRTSIEGLTKTLRDFMAEQQGISEQNVIPYTEMNKFDELYTYFEVCSQELRELIAKQHTLQEEMEHVIKNQSTYINTSKAPTCGTRLFL